MPVSTHTGSQICYMHAPKSNAGGGSTTRNDQKRTCRTHTCNLCQTVTLIADSQSFRYSIRGDVGTIRGRNMDCCGKYRPYHRSPMLGGCGCGCVAAWRVRLPIARNHQFASQQTISILRNMRAHIALESKSFSDASCRLCSPLRQRVQSAAALLLG